MLSRSVISDIADIGIPEVKLSHGIARVPVIERQGHPIQDKPSLTARYRGDWGGRNRRSRSEGRNVLKEENFSGSGSAKPYDKLKGHRPRGGYRIARQCPPRALRSGNIWRYCRNQPPRCVEPPYIHYPTPSRSVTLSRKANTVRGILIDRNDGRIPKHDIRVI